MVNTAFNYNSMTKRWDRLDSIRASYFGNPGSNLIFFVVFLSAFREVP
jgi:hypothetical protein